MNTARTTHLIAKPCNGPVDPGTIDVRAHGIIIILL